VKRLPAALLAAAAIFAGCNVQTEPATNVTRTAFRAHATVQCDANQRLKTWWERRVVGTAWDRVRYHQSTVFDCPPGGIPPSRSAYTFRGLDANTRYHYRICVKQFEANGYPAVGALCGDSTQLRNTEATDAVWDEAVTRGSWVYPWKANGLWRRRVPKNPTLDPNSQAMMNNLVAAIGTRQEILSYSSYGPPVVPARTDGQGYNVQNIQGWTWTLMEAGPVPIPDEATPSPGTDDHLIVYDNATGRAWDMYDAHYDEVFDTWSASAGSTYLTRSSDGIAPSGTAGATSANFPLLGGLIRPEEINAGVIKHPLVFASPDRGHYHVPPATHHGSPGTDDRNAITEGHRLQLDPAFNVDAMSIPTWNKIILKAMQRYGMYFRDGSPAFTIYAENVDNRPPGSPTYPSAILNTTYPPLEIPWRAVRVLDWRDPANR
jgi:hypothetical protein